ncbi:MAG TPA: TIGR03862 family flavoprotein [Alphaproteobacteria bacterium]|nr:TIGR03862 family flavoprotein [Alphaproteobacteria bacterium]
MKRTVAIVGGGPAGLMAAEAAASRGSDVHVFDSMPSVGRKFLMAGKSGLNLTHAEPFSDFLDRFGGFRPHVQPALEAFGPTGVRDWAAGLGIEIFVGSSGRVFPTDFKAAPLLRAWLRRLRGDGVQFHVRHRWMGWDESGRPSFETPAGRVSFAADALILALGGGSWPNLGSTGAWVSLLAGKGVPIAPLQPANCGFDVAWSEYFCARFAGHPVKPVTLASEAGSYRGEFVISETGIEGSGVYLHSAVLRDGIAADGSAVLTVDLLPDWALPKLVQALYAPRGSRSMAEHLRRTVNVTGVKAGLLRECLPPEGFADPTALARGLKALPIRLIAPRPIVEAISSAGGVRWNAVDERLMLRAVPGAFVAGEMLDWEVTTGGYLLTACLALGRQAGLGAVGWLDQLP